MPTLLAFLNATYEAKFLQFFEYWCNRTLGTFAKFNSRVHTQFNRITNSNFPFDFAVHEIKVFVPLIQDFDLNSF